MVRDVRDERDLARRCRAGSEAAYAELVRSHRPRLYLLAYRLTGDRQTAEDVVQETFLAAFRSIEKVEPRPSLSPWLNTILLRIAGRAAQRSRLRRTSSLDQAPRGDSFLPFEQDADVSGWLVDSTPAGDPHVAAETAELRRALAAAIDALPYKYRAPVVLRYVMGFEYVEAATQLEIPLNTFKSHLLRGVRMLRSVLAEQLETPDLEERPSAGPAATASERSGGPGSGTKRGEVGVTLD
jgi:RNA polymerase sigma-70 factor (ECF subfamily)